MEHEQNAKQFLIEKIYEITSGFHPRDYGKHKINILEGTINKLDQLASLCDECRNFQHNFEKDIINKLKKFDNANQREYHLNLKRILSHLRSKHKVITRGYYTESYMSVGTALGLLLGMALGNVAVGFMLGLCVGLAVGAGLDGDAKRKGNVISTPPA